MIQEQTEQFDIFRTKSVSIKPVISVKLHQCNILLICGEKFHNGFLGQRTMKVSNISELQDSAWSSRTLNQDGFVLTWEAIILCPTTQGHVTLLPVMASKLMALIYSLQGFYIFIILNKPWQRAFVECNTEQSNVSIELCDCECAIVHNDELSHFHYIIRIIRSH